MVAAGADDIFKDFFYNLPIGAYRTSPDGDILHVNEACLKIFGYDSLEEIRTKKIKDFYVTEEAFHFYREVMIEKGRIEGLQLSMYRKDGKVIEISDYAVAKKDENGNILFYEGTMEDITPKDITHKRMQYRIEFENLVASISSHFVNLPASEIDKGIDDALERIGKFMGVDRSYVFLFSHDLTLINNTHEWCNKGISPQIENLQQLPAEEFPWWIGQLKKHNIINLSSLDEIPKHGEKLKKVLRDQNILSLVVVPMIYEGNVKGFLGFDSVRKQRSYSNETIALLRFSGETIIGALIRKKYEEEIEIHQRHLEEQVDARTKELQNANNKLTDEIAERKQYEQALHESKQNLQQVIDGAPFPVFIIDFTSVSMEYQNPKAKELLGYELYEINTPEKWYFNVIADPGRRKELFDKFWKDLRRVRDDDEHIIVSFEVKTKKGRFLMMVFDIVKLPSKKILVIGQDRTRQLRAEQNLRISEARYRSLVENINEWIWETDTDGFITYSSPQIINILGYYPEETVRKHITEFLILDKEENTGDRIANYIEARVPFQGIQKTCQHKNGKLVYLESSGVPIFDQQKVFLGFRGADRDVSDKVKVEKSIIQSEHKLSAHIQKTPLAYIEWDMNKEVLDWNQAAKRIFGFTKSEAVYSKIFDSVFSDRKSYQAMEDSWQKTMKSDVSHSFIALNYTKNNKQIYCEWFNTPIKNTEGELSGLASMVQDVTTKVKSDQERDRLISILEQSDELILLIKPNQKIVEINSTGKAMLGIGDEEVSENLNLAAFQSLETTTFFDNDIIPAAELNGRWVGKIELRNKTGQKIKLVAKIIAIYDNNRNAVYYSFFGWSEEQYKKELDILLH